jgi:alpha-glucosidase (family GH31 glycosyl hydrolase)
LSANEPGHPSGKLEPFPLASVRLAPGIFKEQEEINARYLDSLAVDRLLHPFQITAGISSSATPYKGWEDPTCELRGHFAGGHYRLMPYIYSLAWKVTSEDYTLQRPLVMDWRSDEKTWNI